MSYIKIENLSVRYPFQNKYVLNHLNLDINKGDKVLILGRSGGGKSTLSLTLNGLIPHSVEADLEGEIAVNGLDPQLEMVGEMSQHVGILFQDPESQFCMQTVEDEIVFGLENLKLSHNEMVRRLHDALALMNLTAYRQTSIHHLSGGMKQKLGLACILAMGPEVIILDEPTANLDPVSTTEVFQLLERIAQELNKTIIFIEHKLDHLLPMIDHVFVLGTDGYVINHGTPRQLFQHDLELIEKEGVWTPRLCQYAKQLEERGFNWRLFPISLFEWQEGITQIGNNIDQGVYQSFIDDLACVQHESHDEQVQTQVEWKDVSFAYGEHIILDQVNMRINKGEFIALVGPNGTGKSTLAKLIIRLLEPDQGHIHLNDQDITQLSTHELIRKIGFVFQNPEYQFIRDTVEEELAYGLQAMGWTEQEWRAQVNQLLTRFGLTAHRQDNPFTLSQGQKRRLSVATMLINNQQILILDEPTFGQDQANTQALMTLLYELNQEGKTIIMITHDMELVAEYASQIVLLLDGSIAYQGPVGAFFRQKDLLQSAALNQPLAFTLKSWLEETLEAAQHARTLPKK